MKQFLKYALIRLGIFYDLRWSRVFLYYYYRINPDERRQFDREMRFLRSFFSGYELNLIFDIGSNVGTRATQFLQLNPAKLVCFEPDPKNQLILDARFRRCKQVVLESVAVSSCSGKSDFYILRDGDALNSIDKKWKSILENPITNRWDAQNQFQRTIEVRTVTLSEMIKLYGNPDYCKIDVEGHEWDCISNLKQPVSVLSFECNLPEFLTESLQCLHHLYQLNPGYSFGFYNDGDDFINGRLYDYLSAVDFIQKSEFSYLEVFAITERVQ